MRTTDHPMFINRLLDDDQPCTDWPSCPQALDIHQEQPLLQGYKVIDPATRSRVHIPDNEDLLRFPADLLISAGQEAELFRLFTSVEYTSVFRLEALPQYLVEQEDQRFNDFLKGRPLEPRTPETSSWLRVIAQTTAAGRTWRRVRVLSLPLSDYLRFELSEYPSNVNAGEQIRVIDRAERPAIAAELEGARDFWLLERDDGEAVAILMVYDDDDGRYLRSEISTDPDIVARCRRYRDLTWDAGTPLADWLPKASLPAPAVST